MIPINMAGSPGVILDFTNTVLPPNAWTAALNIQFSDGFATKVLGNVALPIPPADTPYGFFPYAAGSNYFGVFPSLTKVYATDYDITEDITNVSEGYNATTGVKWSGGNFGGLLVLTNPLDPPQVWLSPGLATPLTDLQYSPGNSWRDKGYTCGVLRPLQRFLVALDITKGASRYPQLVKWSTQADAGTTPATWDETDLTSDAGEYPLMDTGGTCVDLVPMRDFGIIYKQDSIWLMHPIGGVFIWKFASLTKEIGALATSCIAALPDGRHVAIGVDDVVIIDGQTVQSIASQRIRRTLFNSMDSANYAKSFVVVNIRDKEVWVCVPETGKTWPSIAYTWHWETNAWSVRALDQVTAAASGIVTAGTSTTWNATPGVWDEQTRVWDTDYYSPSNSRFITTHASGDKVRLHQVGNLSGLIPMEVKLERVALGIPFHANEPPDTSSVKFVRGVWPRITGTPGGRVKVTLGAHDHPLESPRWGETREFIIGQTTFLDDRVSGRLLAIRFESNTDVDWRLSGYDLDVIRGGYF